MLLANPDELRLADVYRMFVFEPDADIALVRMAENAVEQGSEPDAGGVFRKPG